MFYHLRMSQYNMVLYNKNDMNESGEKDVIIRLLDLKY